MSSISSLQQLAWKGDPCDPKVCKAIATATKRDAIPKTTPSLAGSQVLSSTPQYETCPLMPTIHAAQNVRITLRLKPGRVVGPGRPLFWETDETAIRCAIYLRDAAKMNSPDSGKSNATTSTAQSADQQQGQAATTADK